MRSVLVTALALNACVRVHVRVHAQALALEAAYEKDAGQGDSIMEDNSDGCSTEAKMFYEITVASLDQPKLLSRLSEALVRG